MQTKGEKDKEEEGIKREEMGRKEKERKGKGRGGDDRKKGEGAREGTEGREDKPAVFALLQSETLDPPLTL